MPVALAPREDRIQNPVPDQFAHLDEANRQVRVTVSRDNAGPRISKTGIVDADAVAAHYGL